MSYSRPSVQPGRGLTRTPALPDSSAVGVFDYALESDIATTTSLGVVQVGSGLSITSAGILSATGGGSSFINVSLVSVDYTATIDNYYIGATKSGITITLPPGVAGKVFIVKNQVNGSVKVQGSAGELFDDAIFKTLGADASLIAVFDGFRWNLV
jgi:hypothetical protein